MTRPTSGCQAHDGCEKAEQCQRHQIYRDSTAYAGFNAHQLCRNTEFVEKHYEHFLEKTNERRH